MKSINVELCNAGERTYHEDGNGWGAEELPKQGTSRQRRLPSSRYDISAIVIISKSGGKRWQGIELADLRRSERYPGMRGGVNPAMDIPKCL
jgi:hypothetical protein